MEGGSAAAHDPGQDLGDSYDTYAHEGWLLRWTNKKSGWKKLYFRLRKKMKEGTSTGESVGLLSGFLVRPPPRARIGSARASVLQCAANAA